MPQVRCTDVVWEPAKNTQLQIPFFSKILRRNYMKITRIYDVMKLINLSRFPSLADFIIFTKKKGSWLDMFFPGQNIHLIAYIAWQKSNDQVLFVAQFYQKSINPPWGHEV